MSNAKIPNYRVSDDVSESIERINGAVQSMRNDPKISKLDDELDAYSKLTLDPDSDGGIEVTEKEIALSGELYGIGFREKGNFLKGTNLTDEEKLLALHGLQNPPFLKLLNEHHGKELPKPDDLFNKLAQEDKLEHEEVPNDIDPARKPLVSPASGMERSGGGRNPQVSPASGMERAKQQSEAEADIKSEDGFSMIDSINKLQANPEALKTAIAKATHDSEIIVKVPDNAVATNTRSAEILAQAQEATRTA